MKVLLINPPDELEAMFGVGKAFVQKYEPIGLLSIAAVAREAGHEVRVIDAYAEDLDLAQLMARIALEKPEVIGISTLTCNGALVFELGRRLKAAYPQMKVVLGNVHAAVFAEAYLRLGAADAVVHGEGDLVFAEILKRWQTGKSLAGLKAVSFRNPKGEVIPAQESAVVEDLAALPMPARDLVDQHLYRLTEISNQNFVGERTVIAKTMVTSRGCPYRCSFCVVHQARKPRYNSVERTVDEFELLEKQYRADYVYLMDPLFMGNPRRVMDICAEIRRRNLRIKWGCDASVNFITPELVRAMAAANCYEMSLGIESGVQRLLDAVEKKITPAKVREAIRIIRAESDIRIEGLFILGLPGETEKDTNETIRFASSLDLDMAQFSILTPYPGSPLFAELAARGEIDTGLRPDGSLEPSVWRHYSSYVVFTENKPIWVTPGLTGAKIRALQKKALRSFYLRPRQFARQLRRINLGNFAQAAKIALKGFF